MPRNSRWVRHLLLVSTATTALVVAPTAASSLTCAIHPHATPRAVAEGTEDLVGDRTFREVYDGAIFGTVVSMTTQEDDKRTDHGRTEVVVDVTGTFGPAAGSQAVVVEDDPGWLNGYEFRVGTHYFIPYVLNDKGMYSHLCDPIAEVQATDVAELVNVAEENGWEVSASGDTSASSAPTQAMDAEDDQGPSEDAGTPAASDGAFTIRVLGLLVLLGVAVAGAVGLRTRNRSPRREDDSPR